MNVYENSNKQSKWLNNSRNSNYGINNGDGLSPSRYDYFFSESELDSDDYLRADNSRDRNRLRNIDKPNNRDRHMR